MPHNNFQGHRPFGSGEDFFKVFTIYRRGSHLGHVTWTVLTHSEKSEINDWFRLIF